MKHVCTSVKYAGDKLVDNFKSVNWKDVGTKALNGLQTALDVAGLVPGFGEIADGVNVLIYAGRGDLVNAGLSAAAMIPFLGWGATGGKAVNKVVKYGDDVVDVGKTAFKYTDELADAAGAVTKGSKKVDLNLGSTNTNNLNNLSDLTNGACFIAGTLIFTAEGKKKIEDIQVGDYVYARDQFGGEQDYKEVTRVFLREKSILIHLVIDGETITTTEEHPFYIEGEGFVEASELKVGDLAETSDGETVPIEAVEVEHLEEPVTVYNFEVEDYHTYYVGDAEVLVHNTCTAGGATTNNLRRNENQQALHDIAKESTKQAKKGNPISYDEARILDEWAEEYKVSQHHQAYEGSGKHFPGGNYQDHTHIYNVHVPYK